MTVLLLGIGADTTNCEPTPQVYEDKRFEYIPIPESEGPEGTTESKTYGNTQLRHGSGTLSEYVDRVNPGGSHDEWISGAALHEWPLHHDPNFDTLTYGESFARGDYVKKLRSLDSGDIVAFYTGLRAEDASVRARYVIGYFTVDSILDLSKIEHGDRQVGLSDLPVTEQRELMEQHAENAHAKRFLATGSLKADDDGVLIVDGTTPGGRLERAVKISDHRGGGHHYLSEDMKSELLSGTAESPAEDYYLGGIKKPHLFDIDPERFIQVVRAADGG